MGESIDRLTMMDRIIQLFPERLRFFSDKDHEIPFPLSYRFKHFVKLIKKLDSNTKYISSLMMVHSIFVEANKFRNCLAHCFSYADPINGDRTVRHVYETDKVWDEPTKEIAEFVTNTGEIEAVAQFFSAAAHYVSDCAYEAYMEYGTNAPARGAYLCAFSEMTWPDKFRNPPYPWNLGRPAK
ncbi:hypothetical protein [Aestuariivirga sp.]|uniref:hypothetical protein n=1 Tax=Aestuariivirga sp. TaxID=2650926 RepID=UPI0039E47F06